ncbi:MAG: PIG-L family deacetylase [Fimbriimonadales bacterium]|nr:PIG-L family deacetylase [Fimbriimonadales bacterium]
MRVLAIGAHPDDWEFHCGGTLLLYRRAGHEVVVCIATNGDKGSKRVPSRELAEIRRRESQAAADRLGAELLWLGFEDGALQDGLEERMAFVEAIRRARPDVVLAHDPDDYHPDHRASARLVRDALFLSMVPQFATESPALTWWPSLYWMDSCSPQFLPTDYVDVTDVFAEKEALLALHASQAEWIDDLSQTDIGEPMRVTNRFRGLACGAKYAEAFCREVRAAGGTASRLLP